MDHFQKIFTNTFIHNNQVNQRLSNIATLTLTHLQHLNKAFDVEEIKKAIFSIPLDNSLGLDGFTARFYQIIWHIVGKQVVDKILSFLT